ncbi:hypothetical protein P154DRAFT_536109 [Amniculicola lignicola CBS 123094]|uniref:Apple domain-containing protein n=1 Tax=Amniculicola lignicola CBS 123094 TaxID=1392246 RepID=A0A6A5WDC7_9PLEO|nr:hypothetical protein P154DRAFT_536109 [Amniculicola lignicola CBS 123094]
MGRASNRCLLALLWASAALATPLIATPLDSRADLTACPNGITEKGNYTSNNGMSFTTYCGQNNPFNDAHDPFLVPTMQECMERCSRFWGDGEGCFGIVWREDQNCWLRNSNVTLATLEEPEGGIHFAMVDKTDMVALDTDCPATDLSTHTLDNGIGYTVHCDKMINGYDACFQGYPECFAENSDDSSFRGFYHATSLDDCLNYCVQEHPLCRGVFYNPGLEIGFANCWLKTGFSDGIESPGSNIGVIHSAAITSLDRIDTSCPSSEAYTTSNNKQYEIHCNQLNTGTNLTSVHRENITSCIDTCSNREKCIGVVFDSSLLGGYENCYLQNTTSVITDQASATYAILADTPLPSSTSSATSSPSSSASSDSSTSSSNSPSRAWIAGPVIGGLAGLAIIGLAIFWWRRYKSPTSKAAAKSDYVAAPAYSPYGGDASMGHVHGAGYAPVEIGGERAVKNHPSEMAATEYMPSSKYARREPDAEPQELP